jgi:hypothetical protein
MTASPDRVTAALEKGNDGSLVTIPFHPKSTGAFVLVWPRAGYANRNVRA